MGLPYGENFIILTSTIFDWSTRLTDGRTGDNYSYMLLCAKIALLCGRKQQKLRKQTCNHTYTLIFFLGNHLFMECRLLQTVELFSSE